MKAFPTINLQVRWKKRHQTRINRNNNNFQKIVKGALSAHLYINWLILIFMQFQALTTRLINFFSFWHSEKYWTYSSPLPPPLPLFQVLSSWFKVDVGPVTEFLAPKAWSSSRYCICSNSLIIWWNDTSL